MSFRFISFVLLLFVTPLNLWGDFRTWTDTDGQTVEAEFISADERQVRLKLKNGDQLLVPISGFRPEDRQFIQQQMKKKPATPKTAAKQDTRSKTSNRSQLQLPTLNDEALRWLNLAAESAHQLKGHDQHKILGNHLGRMFVLAGDVRPAYGYAENIDKIHVRSEVLAHIGEAQLEVGDFAGAVQTADKIMELVPFFRFGDGGTAAACLIYAKAGKIERSIKVSLDFQKKARGGKMDAFAVNNFVEQRRRFAHKIRAEHCAKIGLVSGVEYEIDFFKKLAAEGNRKAYASIRSLNARLAQALIKSKDYERALTLVTDGVNKDVIRVEQVLMAMAADVEFDSTLERCEEIYINSFPNKHDQAATALIRGFLDRGMLDEAFELTANDVKDRTQPFKWILIEEVRRSGGPKLTRVNFTDIVRSMDEKEKLLLAQSYIEAGQFQDALTVPDLGPEFFGRINAMAALHLAQTGVKDYTGFVRAALNSQETRGRTFTKMMLLIKALHVGGHEKEAIAALFALAEITRENAISDPGCEVHQLCEVALLLNRQTDLQNWISERKEPHVRAFAFSHAADVSLLSNAPN